MEFLNKYTRENNLELKLNNIKPKYICLICKGILCEPQVTKCKCSFCEFCIRSYVATGAVQCPKFETDINPDTDIYPHVILDDKIPDLELECPTGRCGELVAIRNMEGHLRECTHTGVHCPLQRFGCPRMLRDSDGVNAHLTVKLEQHFDLVAQQIDEAATLIDIIQNGNSEHSKKFKDDNQALESARLEIQNLKVENQNIKDKIVNFQASFYTIKCEVTNDIDNLKQDLDEVNMKLDSFQIQNDNLKQNIKIISEQTAECLFKFTFTKILERPKESSHFSKIFIANGYMFKVRMLIEAERYVNFYVLSLMNYKSDQLKWPIPFNMGLKVEDKNGVKIKESHFKYKESVFNLDYEKPSSMDLFLNESRIKLMRTQVKDECTVVFSVFNIIIDS